MDKNVTIRDKFFSLNWGPLRGIGLVVRAARGCMFVQLEDACGYLFVQLEDARGYLFLQLEDIRLCSSRMFVDTCSCSSRMLVCEAGGCSRMLVCAVRGYSFAQLETGRSCSSRILVCAARGCYFTQPEAVYWRIKFAVAVILRLAAVVLLMQEVIPLDIV